MSRPAFDPCAPVAPRVRRRLLAHLARTLLWGAASAAMAVPLFSPGSPVSLVRVAMDQPASIVITGSIDHLAAGEPAELRLALHSSSDAATPVHHVSVRVTGATAGCSANALSVGEWSGQLEVAAHGAADVLVPVQLGAGTHGCDGATWQLAYTSV